MISRLEAGYSAERGDARSIWPTPCATSSSSTSRWRRRSGVALEATIEALRGGRRQPRADRPGAVQHRRQRHQIFGRRRRCKAAVTRGARDAAAARSGCPVADNGRAFPMTADRAARHRALRAAGEEPLAAGLRPGAQPRQGGHDASTAAGSNCRPADPGLIGDDDLSRRQGGASDGQASRGRQRRHRFSAAVPANSRR